MRVPGRFRGAVPRLGDQVRFRKLWSDAAADSRQVAVPRARAKGVYTDEDVFRLIS